MCHLISVVAPESQLRFWPLWWHLSKARHGPALLDRLPGPGICRIKLGKIPEGGAHIDVRLDTREPLLWKGDDFGHTGIASALTPRGT